MESVLSKPNYDRIQNSAENLKKVRDTQPSTPIKGRVRIRSPAHEDEMTNDRCSLVYYPPKPLTGTVPSMASDSKVSLHSSLLSSVMPHSNSLQSASLLDRDMTPTRKAKVAELENTTIFRQRGELQLLLAELRERDRELNSMVEAHTKQLAAWERDRNTIRNLEDKCQQLQGEICSKNDEIRTLTSRLRLAESENTNKQTALTNCQQQLSVMTEKHSHMGMEMEDLQKQIEVITQHHSLSAMEVQELEEKNRSLTRTIMDLNTTVGQFDAREQELITVLKLKDKDMSESCSRISELTSRLQKQETALESSRRVENEMRRSASDWKNKYDSMWKEYEHCKRVLRSSDQKNGELTAELQRFKQEVPTLRKEHILSSEREKRRSDMLELEQSRGARMEMELSNLRDLCERQQRDLAVLEQNLHNTRDIVQTQQQRILNQRQVDATIGRSSVQQNKTAVTTSYTRSRSPTSRSPTRTSTRSPTRYSSSPDRSQSRIGHVSPSRYRALSPQVGSYRAKSPVQRKESPERYYPSYSSKYPPTPSKDSSFAGSIPKMNSSGYYADPYTKKYDNQSQKYQPAQLDAAQDLPYKSYSSDITSEKYKSQGWSTTKALAHATDDIINKYYPLRDVPTLPEPSPPHVDSEQSSQVSTPRANVLDVHSSDKGKSHDREQSVHSQASMTHGDEDGPSSGHASESFSQQRSAGVPLNGPGRDGTGSPVDGPQQVVDDQQSSQLQREHWMNGGLLSRQIEAASLHSDTESQHSAQVSVQSQHSVRESLHSQHSDRESFHSQQNDRMSHPSTRQSQHSIQGSVELEVSPRESVHSQHSDRESIQSHQSGNRSVQSSGGVSHHTDTGSVHSGLRRDDTGSRHSSFREEEDLVLYGHQFNSSNGFEQNGLQHHEREEQIAVAAAATEVTGREHASNASTPRSNTAGSVRSDSRSVHSSTGTAAVAQMNEDQGVDDFFAPKPSKPAPVTKQLTDQSEEADLDEILAASREVAEQLERSSQASVTPTPQNGHREFYEELQE